MAKYSTEELLALDKKHVWHPYSSMTHPPAVTPIVSANGVRLTTSDGVELIDGMSSWWSAIHGYNHPILNQAAIEQINTMSHVMFGGLTHPKAVELSQLLVELTPEPLNKVFLCDSGSVACEVAIKMAIQFWFSQGKQEKSKLLTIKSGYHGDTFGAMAVCDPVTGMHEIFTSVLPQHHFAPAPNCKFNQPCSDEDISGIQQLIVRYHDELAAVILEPIVQGAGGMNFYSPEYLSRVRKLCDQYDVLLICDEIATGFGRTGKMFAIEHADITPDILCLGKAMTGGYMTLAATLCTNKVSEGICQNDSVFMHGPTFMGNPLACAVAIASIKLLLSTPWKRRISTIEQQLKTELSPCRSFDNVVDVRVLGAIGVVEVANPVDMLKVSSEFIKRGIWVRPFGTRVYIMPPYIIEKEDLTTLTTGMKEVIQLCQ